MKIAIFTDTFLPQINGVTNTLSRLGDYLTQKEIEYIFLTPQHPSKDHQNYNIEKFFSTNFLFYPECRFTFPNTLRINQILSQFKPDIIQLMTEFNVGLSGKNYAKKHNIPYVTNFSTNYEDILTAYNMGLLNKTMWRYCKKFHSEAILTLTPSKETEKLIHTKGITRTKLFTRGIDYERFHPNHRNDALRKSLNIEDKIVMLYVGRVSPEKGLSILRDSMIKLTEKYQDQIALIITGDGPMLPELKATMPKNVLFTGYKKGHELSEIYASSDIFAFPSGFETFGNVALEAMASGIPVVGVAQGGVMESIIPHRTGLLAKPNDVTSFTECLDELIQNNEMRHQLGWQARKFAETKSWDSIFNELIQTYEDIIHMPNVSPQIMVS
ncbi:MAG: glycosyltransferase family 1 protein [Vallitaleaceae bacterium]|nr:glycosyltransferase family 1 protein [Vallitaleaceae bacterium]